MTMKRRMFLKSALAAGTVGVAVGAGLLTPTSALAAWPKAALEAKSVDAALKAAGFEGATPSGDIKLKAPDIAENGAVVPVEVTAKMSGVTSIGILIAKNGTPLSSTYEMGKGATGFVGTRVKMGKTSDVIALVKAGGKVYSAKKEVKVTIGGCGG